MKRRGCPRVPVAEHLTSIRIEETRGVVREREPVRIGVPIPRGMVADALDCSLTGPHGEELPHQCRLLARWPDRSVKWLLVDALVSVAAGQQFDLSLWRHPGGGTPAPQGLTLQRSGDSVLIETGAAECRIDARSGGGVPSVRFGDEGLISGGRLVLRMADGAERLPRIRRIEVEEVGPVRATVCIEVDFDLGRSRASLFLRSRLSFFAGTAVVRQEVLVRNSRAALHPGGVWDLGDPGSLRFADLSLHLACAQPVREMSWSIGDAGSGQRGSWPGVVIYQDSSGGENWDSPNHIDASGALSARHRGYRVTAAGARGPEILDEGDRASPFAQAMVGGGWVAVTVEGFWQNFPKALRVGRESLSVGLFPGESAAGFELQGGEQKRHVVWWELGLPRQVPSVSALRYPLQVSLDPDWVERSRTVPWFAAPTPDEDSRCTGYVASIVDGPNSFVRKRERVDEYGWRSFGDLYADHEAVHHRGPKPLVSHYNNQYDFVFGALSQFLRTGDGRWWALLKDAAQHTIDIDIYHTQEDRAAYNGGMFWHTDHYKEAATCGHRTYSRHNGGSGYGGGPSNEHNYTSGLLLYYYLTGDPEAAAAVRELAHWVIAMDDGGLNLFGLVDAGPTGLASRTVDDDYHGPGRGAGNSVNAVLDAYHLARERCFLVKAEELIQRCIHPADDIGQHKLDEPEYRWSYLVFLQVLGKYLDLKQELGEMDYGFHYAREGLVHYARWMALNEVPYKAVLHKMLIPTETWPAQDIRKCHVFHLAAKWSAPGDRESFAERAGYFFGRCLNDLLSFETAYLTRPLVILSVYGHAHAYYCRHGAGLQRDWKHDHCFGQPAGFVPQRARVGGELRRKLRMARAELVRLLRDKGGSLRRRSPGSS
nr:hypothetical protein [Thiococcus pfennigii]